jgi:hypothetical protein
MKRLARFSLGLAALSVLAFHGYEAATHWIDRRQDRPHA